MLTGITSSMPLTNARSQLTRQTATEWVIDWRLLTNLRSYAGTQTIEALAGARIFAIGDK
jgi:hypothetical protein